MRLLLDTHAFVWAVVTPEKLSEDLKAQVLPVTQDHAIRAGLMTSEHRDPFDRMLAAQARLEDLYIVTRDPAFAALGVRVVW